MASRQTELASETNIAPIIDRLDHVYRNPNDNIVTVIGVVTEVLLPPRRTARGGSYILLHPGFPTFLTRLEWMLTFNIIDCHLALIPTPYKGMKARIFCKVEEHLPQVKAIGDVVLLRHVKVSLVVASSPPLEETCIELNYTLAPYVIRPMRPVGRRTRPSPSFRVNTPCCSKKQRYQQIPQVLPAD